MKNVILASGDKFPAWAVILILLAFFGLIVIAVIFIKMKVKPLQIKKDEIDEKDAIKEELDRILVPVDEETQKQMDEAMKKDGKDE